MEVTKREIIASITIIAIMLLVGTLIASKISEYQMDSREKYNKATKIQSTELFEYGMSTNIGNAFVYGELEAIDSVGYPEIQGEYLAIKKVKERYTMHTRVVTTTVNGKSVSKTETYWTWDEVAEEKLRAKKVKFCGVTFNSSQFNIPSGEYIKTIRKSSKIRYKYYGLSAKIKGTIFTHLADGNIEERNVPIYRDKTIEETTEYLDSDFSLVWFWIFWTVLIIMLVYGFYYLENRWLDN